MAIPKVFVSYSHDSQEHKKWVLDIATRLRNTGVDAIIDQWELKPGDDLPHFMETHLASSDYVVMVCSDRYVEKANSGVGGVGYEKMIITSDLLSNIDSNKVIPIIRQSGSQNVPTFLKSKLFVDFSRDDQFEFSFDELVRTLLKSPLFIKPEIGNNPFTPVKDIPVEKSGDGLRELIVILVSNYERNVASSTSTIHHEVGISRIMCDILTKDAINKGLVVINAVGYIDLTDKGKLYALNHNLIS